MIGDKHGAAMGKWLRVYAWVALIVGTGLSLGSIYPFNDSNMALMTGIGCLIAAPVVYIASWMFPLAEAYVTPHSDDADSHSSSDR